MQAVPRGHLQLTAVACQMIASKMEQETHPAASAFTNIADHCFQVHSAAPTKCFHSHLALSLTPLPKVPCSSTLPGIELFPTPQQSPVFKLASCAASSKL